ncbi:C-C motif chemokine 4-like [Sphaeramia orbicularis]|uniref:C-C motif chemokine 4-like n=1 Tax=Sphaeramia orbicularis TaxID=375764 RepID=UPI00117BEF50|nr:C-C motif chemokine 4-like [Sphaeramia orbicularis]
MRTLMLMMLMLISIDACSAMPRAVNDIAPVSCCVQFFTGNIPPARIVSIKKTDSTCTNKAFVVTTVKGAQICVHDTWVHSVFKQPSPTVDTSSRKLTFTPSVSHNISN